jgi:AraC-like DNA-binding protein
MALELVEAGRIRLTQDGRTSLAEAGMVFVLKLGADHTYAADGVAVRKRFLGLSGVVAEQITAALPDVLPVADPAAIARVFLRLRSLLRRRPAGYQAEASQIAYRLLTQLLISARTQSGADAPHPALSAALDALERTNGRDLTSVALARAAGTSTAHLHRLFRAAFRTSPLRYARQQAMRRAQALLGETTLSCREIARRLGYHDPDYFSAVFRRETGEAPMAYRLRMRG